MNIKQNRKITIGTRCFLLLIAVLHLSFPGPTTAFLIYDALLYTGKPDLTEYGLSPFKVVYDSELWEQGESKDEPNLRRINAKVKQLNPKVPVCIDIEHWPTRGDDAAVARSISRYLTVIEAFRKTLPATVIGFYGVIPGNDYWRAINARGSGAHEEWQQENARLRKIAVAVDAVFPSLYTYYPDPAGWETYAIENLREARKYGKPVYAFLWPEYHGSNLTYKGRNLPVDFWRRQLETCLKYADGVVIWGGWQKQWDDTAPWWLETKRFLQQHRSP